MSDLDTEVYESITALNQNQWNNLVGNSERGSIFQRYDWLLAVESTLDVDPKHIVVSKDGNPIGVLPNFVTDIPIVPLKKLESVPLGSGGPVISSNEGKVLELLLRKVEQVCTKKIIAHEVTAHDGTYLRYGQQLADDGYRPQRTHCRFVIDLTQPWDSIKAAMSSERRNLLRKAIDQEFRVTEAELTSNTLRSFHQTYEAAMERVNASPHPVSFFEQLAEDFLDHVRLMRAFVEGDLVGSHFYVEDGDCMHHLFSAIYEENFEYYPSELIHRHMMRTVGEDGFKKYDFGSTVASFDDGIFTYKNSYGGMVVPNLEWEKPTSRVLYGAYKTGKSIYQAYR